MTWADRAQRFIAEVMKELPADASLKDRQRLLRERRWRFVQGTSWGAKIWPREVRRYLEAHHGLPRRTPADSPALFADDIVFPFRQS